MSEKVDRFCEHLRVTLTGLEARLEDLTAKIERDRESTKAAIDSKVDEARAGLGNARADAEAARARMKAQVEEKKTETKEKIAEWKRNREAAKLRDRAEDLEAYASWAVLVAADALDEANVATLRAIQARLDAEYAATGGPVTL